MERSSSGLTARRRARPQSPGRHVRPSSWAPPLSRSNSWGPIYPVGVEPEENARQELTKVLVQVIGADRAEAVRLVLSPDAPGHLLVQEAVDAEALVIGTHGHATLTGALLGSVSEYCIRHARCSVVVVRAAEHG